MNLSDHVTELYLSNNRITDDSLGVLLTSVKQSKYNLFNKITTLDLSFNKITRDGIFSLCDYISTKDSELNYLNLESNCLENDNIIKICNAITKNLSKKIRYLNFGNNNLNDDSAYVISNLVENCEFLQALILHSNQFKNYGASLIVSKIKKHPLMKIFDISWNLIGDNLVETNIKDQIIKDNQNITNVKDTTNFEESKGYNNAELFNIKNSMEINFKKKLNPVVITKTNQISLFTKELCELFKEKDCNIIHLDISHNNINLIDCRQISIDVKANHSILGIHLDGNEMEIDELGFISTNPLTNYNKNFICHAQSQISYNFNKLIKSKVSNIRKIRSKNNCWICEGWREISFTYKPHLIDIDLNSLSVKLHLNFENFKEIETILHGDQFVCYRMCPPGELLFYFTVNDVPVESYREKTYKLKEAHTHNFIGGDGSKNVYLVTKMARDMVEINNNVIDFNNYEKRIDHCIPRPEKIINFIIKPRTPWTFPISIWANNDYSLEGESEVIYKIINYRNILKIHLILISLEINLSEMLNQNLY